MIDTNIAYAILALVAIYAVYFFLSPYRLAEFWQRDGLPVYWIMQHFRYWEGRRVWISAVGFGACVIVAWLVPASSSILFAMFVWISSLTGADAFQIRRLSRDLPSWSPSAAIGQKVSRIDPVLDLVFGRKATRDRGDD